MNRCCTVALFSFIILTLSFDFVNKIHHLHKIVPKLYPGLTFSGILVYW